VPVQKSGPAVPDLIFAFPGATVGFVTLMGMVMPVFFMVRVAVVMAPVVVRMVMAFMVLSMAVGMRVVMAVVMVVGMTVFVFPVTMAMIMIMAVVMFVVIQFDFHFFLRFKWGAFLCHRSGLSGLFHREAESAGILSIRGTSRYATAITALE
jgi:hypothetical protein